MMNYIIVTRNPTTKKLAIITDGESDVPAEFEDEREAMDAADETPICKAWGYEILEVDAP
jgi:hypothetical protein